MTRFLVQAACGYDLTPLGLSRSYRLKVFLVSDQEEARADRYDFAQMFG